MTIVWTPLAKISYYENLEYLEKSWTPKTILKFIESVEKTMLQVQENPTLFPKWSLNGNYQKGHINKHISFFYSIIIKNIVVHLFWNNLQNPKSLKKLL
ncbi:hypothetical protein HX109_03470 [Galbibacter sp. BG1]|uniref:type II toxin-antitoxin system RelE/ParE family toxin n=1 Tax=Galbibacter sp. BG1 TaxID=1170699 RepID=UPI0015BB9FF1|nr:hypothetical protein [Galbibacter sp. BG1]QLE00667.1 hypothetical protein HX109_03470 [Galbibacter sp. BG1]